MPAATRSGPGSGAPNAAGSPATRTTRSRSVRLSTSRGSSVRSSAPNAVYHVQSDETPPTFFWIT
jgi:hypothetical protein